VFSRSALRKPHLQRIIISALVLLLPFFVGQGRAFCQSYPTRPITLVVPYAPGAATDIFARMLAQELQEQLKQPVIVENKAGAATQIAAVSVSRAAPDGYTLLLASSQTLSVNQHVYKVLNYKPDGFTPIALSGAAIFVLVTSPSIPANSLPELISYIKSRPGELSFATAGSASPHELFMEMFESAADLRTTAVPYKGSLPAITDLLGGVIPIMMVDLAAAQPLIAAGQLKAFGVTMAVRAKSVPDIPTLSEAGLPGFVAQGWYGIVAPGGTPRPIVDRLNAVISSYIKRPDVSAKLDAMGILPITSTPDEFAAFIPEEIKKWAQVVKDAGIQPQ
jgi:tripartite-type tricarboxylate transporter receptor subunit TctC